MYNDNTKKMWQKVGTRNLYDVSNSLMGVRLQYLTSHCNGQNSENASVYRCVFFTFEFRQVLFLTLNS